MITGIVFAGIPLIYSGCKHFVMIVSLPCVKITYHTRVNQVWDNGNLPSFQVWEHRRGF